LFCSKNLGEYKGEEVEVGNECFGPYNVNGSVFISQKENPIDAERAKN
jgi:hypothetical protein